MANDGTLIFKEDASVNIVNGIANYAIGTGVNLSGGPLTSAMLQTTSDIFVQVAVDTDTPSKIVLPRSRLESVPYSLLSADGEHRTALAGPAPITISQSGSYLLTGNLSVSDGDAVKITCDNVTLDLNGFTISSTDALASGSGILIDRPGVGNGNIAILNGHITSNITFTSPTTYGGSGFVNGILYPYDGLPNIRVSHVSVTGCLDNGISIGFNATPTSLVESCTVSTCGTDGILADVITHSLAVYCGIRGIRGQVLSDCTGQGTGIGVGITGLNASNCFGYGVSGSGMVVTNAINCYGESAYGDGIDASLTAENCRGVGDSNGTGISAGSATNCSGTSVGGSGVLVDSTANSCTGSSGNYYGLKSNGVALNCTGVSGTGTGLYAFYNAQNCFGQCTNGASVGLTASNVTGCFGISKTGTGLTITGLGAMCIGQTQSPPASASILGAGSGPTSLP